MVLFGSAINEPNFNAMYRIVVDTSQFEQSHVLARLGIELNSGHINDFSFDQSQVIVRGFDKNKLKQAIDHIIGTNTNDYTITKE